MTIPVTISYGTEWSICIIDECECNVSIDVREDFTVDEIRFLTGMVRFYRYELNFVGYFIGDIGVLDFYGQVLGSDVIMCDIESELVGWGLCFNLYFEI